MTHGGFVREVACATGGSSTRRTVSWRDGTAMRWRRADHATQQRTPRAAAKERGGGGGGDSYTAAAESRN